MIFSKFVRFVVVGVTATILQFLFSWWLLWFGARPAVAATLAFCLAFIFAYNCHRNWVFSTRTRHQALLPRYIVAQLICATSAAITTEATYALQYPDVISAMCATLVSAILAYFLTSRWVFTV